MKPIASLAKEWEKVKSQPAEGGSPDDDSTREALIQLLVLADSPVGIDALKDGLIKCDAETRGTVIMSFDIGGLNNVELNFSGPTPKGKRSPGTQAAMEALLAGELEDTSRQAGESSGEEEGIELPPDLRLCDLAAFQMSRRWPEKYKFKTTASLAEREKERIACLNTWRKSQGLKPVEK